VAEVAPGFSGIQSVTANLSEVGGGSAVPMAYNASTEAYQALISLPAGAPPGIHAVTVTATDANHRTGVGTGPLTVNGGPPLTAAAARLAPLGSTLSVRGIVTATRSGNAAVQDPDAIVNGGGLMLSDGSSRDGVPPLQPGQDVTATGTLELLLGERTLVLASPAAVTVNAQQQALPSPKDLTVTQAAMEANQGRLVRLTGLTVVTPPGTIAAAPRGELTSFIAEDAGGASIRVALHRNATATAAAPYPGPPDHPVPSVTGADGTTTFPQILAGDTYTVTGVLGVWPGGATNVLRVRDADDLVRTEAKLIVTAGASPAIVEQGGTVTVSVTTNPANGTVVTADLRALHGAQTQPLAFDGAAFSLTVAIPPDAPLGSVSIPLQAISSTTAAEQTVRFSIISPLQDGLSIAQARAAPDGTQLRVTGVVTARTIGAAGVYYIADASGGIRAFTSGPDPGYNTGDEISVTGIRDTVQGAASVDATPAPAGIGGMALTGFGKPLPAPAAATAVQWPADAGRLGRTPSLVVLSALAVSGGDAFVVTDGTAVGELYLADRAGFTAADLPSAGAALNVTGIVDAVVSGARDAFQIRPRSPADVSPGTAPPQVPATLAFAAQPRGGWPGQRLAAQPIVVARTQAGQTVTAFGGEVKVAILSGTGTEHATLGGTRTALSVSGVAAYEDLTINKAGAGYVLVAQSGGLSAQSEPFSVGATVTTGDVNGDGALTMDDVRLALKIAAGLTDAASAGGAFSNADVDGDGRITLAECAAIRRLVP
jgi:hypothetical protein